VVTQDRDLLPAFQRRAYRQHFYLILYVASCILLDDRRLEGGEGFQSDLDCNSNHKSALIPGVTKAAMDKQEIKTFEFRLTVDDDSHIINIYPIFAFRIVIEAVFLCAHS